MLFAIQKILCPLSPFADIIQQMPELDHELLAEFARHASAFSLGKRSAANGSSGASSTMLLVLASAETFRAGGV